MPSRGTLAVETHEALSRNMDDIPNIRMVNARKPVDESRNELSASALRVAQDDPMNVGFDNYRSLWIDSDAWWPRGTISQMMRIMDEHPEIDLLVPLFCARQPFCPPAVFREQSVRVVRYSDGAEITKIPNMPLPVSDETGEIVPIHSAGAHFVLHKTSILSALGENPWSPSELQTEDISFYRRLREHNVRCFAATRLAVAHVDADTGRAYMPGQRPLRVVGGSLVYDVSPAEKTDAELIAEIQDTPIRKYGSRVDSAVDAIHDDLSNELTDRDNVVIEARGGLIIMKRAELDDLIRRADSSALREDAPIPFGPVVQ